MIHIENKKHLSKASRATFPSGYKYRCIAQTSEPENLALAREAMLGLALIGKGSGTVMEREFGDELPTIFIYV